MKSKKQYDRNKKSEKMQLSFKNAYEMAQKAKKLILKIGVKKTWDF